LRILAETSLPTEKARAPRLCVVVTVAEVKSVPKYHESADVGSDKTNSIGAISLDQFIALNDEMAALVRAGIPLEEGLAELGQDMPGRLGEIASTLGRRMQMGENLSEILGSDQQKFSPVWRAVVDAGLRSGNLSAALEGMATTGRHVAELRRAVSVAWMYPLVVVALAYCSLVFVVTWLAPVMKDAYEDLTRSTSATLQLLDGAGQTAFGWGLLVPAIVILALAAWWYRTKYSLWSRDSAVARRRPGRFKMHWPTIRQSLQYGRVATFAEVLALLNDQRVPLEEAIVLAANASGDRGLSDSVGEVAARLRRGEVLDGSELAKSQLPPLLGWLAVTGMHQPGANQALALSAEMYRQRAARATAWAAIYLPILLTVALGGIAVLLQALAVFGPISELLYELARE
jgi:general secretion pathway protein F